MTETYIIKLVHRHAGRRNDTVLDTFAPDGEGGWEPVRKSRHEVPLEGTSPFPVRQDWTPKEPEMRPFRADEMREGRKEARRFAREHPGFPEYSEVPVSAGDTGFPARFAMRAASRVIERDLESRIAWQINRRCPGAVRCCRTRSARRGFTGRSTACARRVGARWALRSWRGRSTTSRIGYAALY